MGLAFLDFDLYEGIAVVVEEDSIEIVAVDSFGHLKHL